MTVSSHRRTGSPRTHKTAASLFLVAVAMLWGACTTPASAPASAREPATAETGQRSSKPSGVASRDVSVPVVEITPPRVNLDGDLRLGSLDARIGIVEFSDYECPYCRGFHYQIFPRLKKEYVDTGIVQFIHKDLPLTSIHPQAMPAAVAANCAGAQDRFWQMHEALYANHGRLASVLYPQLARDLGLDEEKFTACLGDTVHMHAVMRDIAAARGLGITGTPSFVIGEIQGSTMTVVRMAKGVPGFEAFVQEIEKLRQQMKSGATP